MVQEHEPRSHTYLAHVLALPFLAVGTKASCLHTRNLDFLARKMKTTIPTLHIGYDALNLTTKTPKE